MVKIKNIISGIISVLFIYLFLMPISGIVFAEADNQEYFENCGLYTEYGLFSESELKEINDTIKQTAEEIDMYVLVYISSTNLTDSETEVFADKMYEDLFGENTDGLFFYVDLSGGVPAYDYISTSGMAILTYTDSKNDGDSNRIDSMLEEIYEYFPSSGEEIKANDIKLGIEEFCRQLKIYAKRGAKKGYYAYDSADHKYIYSKNGKAVISSKKPLFVMFKPLNVLIGLLTGFVVGIVMYFIIKSTYKFKKSCDSSAYIARNNSNFTETNDIFIRQYTDRKRIESSSGSSHHSSGGGSSGGGSHGGGGGHR
ncbi:MAG: hypothetical protein K2G63_07335 [Oscillospiraceae bacterium]|nr:hypothetical protein [Oscillospiraceae bacterium]